MTSKKLAIKPLSDKQTKEQELTLGLSKEEKELLQETGRLEKRNKIYPDFIAAKAPLSFGEGGVRLTTKLFMFWETKGVHLKENDDTRYKKNVFALCNELGAKKHGKNCLTSFPTTTLSFK